MSKLTPLADTTIEYLFYALFFFVPLILWPKTSEVFEFNKMLAVYIITILISAAWIIKWLEAKKITIRQTPLDLPILIFLASQILSTVFSIDTHTSLWGYYSRFHGGLISTIAYLVLYYALVTNLARDKVSFLIYSIMSSAVLVALYGVLEHFGIDRHLWVQDVQSRVFSTIGQPNWLSAYLVALLPLPIFLALAAKNHNYRALWALLALLFAITIIFTKSQSSLAATGLTLAAVAIYFVGRKFRLVYLLIIPLVLILTVSKWDFVVKINPFAVPNLAELVERDRSTRIAGSDSMIIRQVVWQGARELGFKNPLFGTGLETFGYTYFTVRPALHNLLSEWEFLYNKAHNEYLNFLANTGFVGLTAYLLLIGWTIVWWLKTEGPVSRGLLFGYFSILITNYFGFSVVPVALFFFLFPALVFTLSKSKERYLSVNFGINTTLGVGLVIFLAFYLLRIPINQFRSDVAYNTGKQYLSLSAYKQSLD
ncbi:MAG: O-antigen ligase family protein, partial [Microgenomates group bacterium]